MATPAQYIARPSMARVVRLDGCGPQVRGVGAGGYDLCWPAKDPSDVLDYVLDASPALLGLDGDGIVTMDVQVSPQQAGGLVLNSSAVDGDRAVLWLSGGLAGQIYMVTLGLGTASGRYLLRSVVLPVQALAHMVPSPSPYLVDGNGAPLIDQNGSPIISK
jgi:hypothetical protein